MPLELNVALEIILDLARENTLDPTDCDDELVWHAYKQEEALEIVDAYLDELNDWEKKNG